MDLIDVSNKGLRLEYDNETEKFFVGFVGEEHFHSLWYETYEAAKIAFKIAIALDIRPYRE